MWLSGRSLLRTSSEWPHWGYFLTWPWHQLVLKTWPHMPCLPLWQSVWQSGLGECAPCQHLSESPGGGSVSFLPDLSVFAHVTQTPTEQATLFIQATGVRSVLLFLFVKWAIMPGFFLRREVPKVPQSPPSDPRTRPSRRRPSLPF